MATEKDIAEALGNIENDIAGFIGASVVDLESGMTLGVRTARSDFDLAAASAYNSEIVKQKFKTIRALNLKSQLEEILLTLSDQIHMIRLVGTTAFIYLAAERAQSNLAIVRTAVIKHTANLT